MPPKGTHDALFAYFIICDSLFCINSTSWYDGIGGLLNMLSKMQNQAILNFININLLKLLKLFGKGTGLNLQLLIFVSVN